MRNGAKLFDIMGKLETLLRREREKHAEAKGLREQYSPSSWEYTETNLQVHQHEYAMVLLLELIEYKDLLQNTPF